MAPAIAPLALLLLSACAGPAKTGGTATPAGASRTQGVATAGGASTAQGAADAAIRLYQEHLGDQWGWHCPFEPSCSRFAREAYGRAGVLRGTLLTTDRLMRDHPLSWALYPTTFDGRPVDPLGANGVFAAPPPPAPLPSPGKDQEEASRPMPSGEEELFAFAESLLDQQDWDRARVEYLRLLHRFPAGRHARLARERIVLCLSRLGHPREAMQAAAALGEGPSRALLEALVLRDAGQSERAMARADCGTEEGHLLSGLFSLEAGDGAAARRQFAELPPRLRDALLDRADRLDEQPHRSPWLGGTLSAVLPGSGQAWAGRWGDGLLALVLNGVLIGGTAAAAANDEEVTAGALGVLAAGFYAGNVFGGVRAASRFNQEQRQTLLDRTRGMLRQHGASLGLTPQGDGGAVWFYLEF